VPRGFALAFCAWALLAALSVLWSVAPAFSLAELRPEVGYGLAAFAIFFLRGAHPGTLAPVVGVDHRRAR
jgi:hypothetical protein